jgi:membrane-anchored mycosin MYCP
LEPPPTGGPDGLVGIAPDAMLLSVRQTAQTFGLVDPGMEGDPQDIRRAGDIDSLASAVVHLANMGAKVINISVVSCVSVDKQQAWDRLGEALRYAAVDKDVVIVSAAGNAHSQGCKQNPPPIPGDRTDPLGKNSVTTIVAPALFSDYVLSVGATDNVGAPAVEDAASVHGPWVGVAAPGSNIVGLSMTGQVINGSVDNDKLHPIGGSSFSSAFVAGIAALVRAKFPNLTAHQVIHRIEATAHPPAAGRDTAVGYGVVDAYSALTWDVPPGELLAPGVQRQPLQKPPPPPAVDPAPRLVAIGITSVAVVAVLSVAAALAATRRRNES